MDDMKDKEKMNISNILIDDEYLKDVTGGKGGREGDGPKTPYGQDDETGNGGYLGDPESKPSKKK